MLLSLAEFGLSYLNELSSMVIVTIPCMITASYSSRTQNVIAVITKLDVLLCRGFLANIKQKEKNGYKPVDYWKPHALFCSSFCTLV